MSTRAISFLTLLGAASASAAAASASAAAAPAGTPVDRVVHLLEELKGKLVADGKEDHRLYGKYMCWCDQTIKRKAAAIVVAQAKLRELGQLILKYKALIASVMPEANAIKIKITACGLAIDELTAIRRKENAAYFPEVAELMQALAALEKAIVVLHDATKLTLVQGASGSSAAWRAAAAVVSTAVTALPASAALSPDRESMLAAFIQGASRARGGSGYAPQSATLQGILKDMYDTFAAQLEELSMVEAGRNKEFENFIFLKEKEKKALEEDLSHHFLPQAEYEVLLADTQQLYGESEKDMDATIDFFDKVKESCEPKYKEYQVRVAEREEELSGIAKALEILTSDDARELLAKAIKPGQGPILLQMGSAGSGSEAQAAVARAYHALKARATAAHSLRLASLAVAVRMAGAGQFDQVITAIDDMIGVLKVEESGDVEKRDQCKAEYTRIASAAAKVEWEVEKHLNQIHKLESLIEKREGDKHETLVHINAARDDIVAMEDHRKEEHSAFLQAKADDESSIELLNVAKTALTAYYEKHEIPLGPIQASIKAVLLAKQPGSPEFVISEDQAPDAVFTHKDNHKSESKGVVSILTMIIEDLHVEVADGIKSEQEAHAEFDAQLGVAKKLEAELESKVAELNKMIVARKAAWVGEHQFLDTEKAELDELHNNRKEITPDCEWIIHAFEERRAKRHGEMDALEQAKDFLAGSAPPSMLQKGPRRPSDSVAIPTVRFEGVSFLRRRL